MNPFIEYDPIWDELREIVGRDKFDITKYKCAKMKNGWIYILVDWKAEGDNSWKYKYAAKSAISFSRDKASMELEFPHTKTFIQALNFESSFRIVIGLQADEGKLIDYEPLFHQNTSYGTIVYFGPKGWDSTENEEMIPFSGESKEI